MQVYPTSHLAKNLFGLLKQMQNIVGLEINGVYKERIVFEKDEAIL